MIQEAVESEKKLANGAPVIGISGGANGGDILFHEVCQKLEVPTEMYLAIPSKEYRIASVQGAGPECVERFNQLEQKLECKALQSSTELPRWLRDKKGYGIWQRSNLWMLFHALEQAHDRDKGHSCLTLIALWNGKTGDGPGGTADMVKRAEAQGAKSVRLDTSVWVAAS